MSILRICLFGRVRVAHDGRAPVVQDGRAPDEKVGPVVQGLLAYLLLQRSRSHSREVLIDLFWENHREHRAHSCLSTALWRLRQVLEPAGITRGTYLITTPAGDVGFNRQGAFWLDAAAFEEQVVPILAQPITALAPNNISELCHALQLYAGDLLEGYYADWALRERERLRALYVGGLIHLMRYYMHKNRYEESVVHGQEILHLEPLREDIHRDMMRSYMRSGQRTMAVRQYLACRELLALELGISPMEETQALYSEITSADSTNQWSFPSEATGIQHAIEQLNIAMQVFDQARDQLQQAMQYVKRSVECRDLDAHIHLESTKGKMGSSQSAIEVSTDQSGSVRLR